MSKFNTTSVRPAVSSPIVSTPTGEVNHQGGAGYARDLKSELFLLAVSNMVGESTFYESAGGRDDRYADLVRQATVTDPDWTARFLRWLRGDGNMRSASIVGAAEFAKARLDAGEAGMSRQVVDSVLQRADEPGEMLAYWTSRYGRAVPKPVKRGVADAVVRLYDERSLLKWDGVSKGFRFGDVIDLTHPVAKAEWQGWLFRFAIDRRHNRGEAPAASLPMVAYNASLRAVADTDPDLLLSPDALARAGMTWEDALSLAGSRVDKAKLWEAMIPSMGYMALLRNLRNFDQAGVSDAVAAQVSARLADPDQVARSRQFPMRFVSAFKAAPSLRWAWALEQALTLSLGNVPALMGRTLVLVDRSASMQDRLSARSDLNRADAAAIFGTAVAMRAESADLVEFGTGSARVPFMKGGSILPILDSYHWLGGTNTELAVRQHYAGHDRVVIVTDEQANAWGSDPLASVPRQVPAYTWNLAGYRLGHGPSGSGNRHTFGGLTDAAFRMIPLLEAGRSASWPF